MELVSLYPYDPTARATSNKIVNESITVIPPSQITDYSYVVPRAAPFFAETLVVKDGKGVGARTLVENVDYWCVIDFLSASVGLTKRVSVGIALLDPNYSGTLYVSYQTLGGNYTMADYSVLEELIRERYVVKHVSYEQIINLPAGFSPEWHNHEVADMVGMSSVVTSLEGIKTATSSRNGSYGQIEQQLHNHINSASAHTPADIGLGNVKNYGVATLTDAKGGSVSKYVTADILKQYVAFDKTDTSVYLTKSDATLTYQTKSAMGDYYTKTSSDGRYALKSDSYTKTQVDGLINGIDVSDSLSGYYTKSQSDARYAAKSDLDNYSTTSVADGRYATKTNLDSYYNKTESNARYALKSAVYTKTESDGRYLSSTALNGYLTQSAADGRYQSKADMSQYLSKSSHDYSVIKSIEVERGPMLSKFSTIRIVEQKSGFLTEQTAKIDLSNYMLINDAPGIETYNTTIDSIRRGMHILYIRSFTNNVPYRNYSLPIKWKIVRNGGMVHITWECTTSFYWDENRMNLYTPDSKLSSLNTSLPANNVSSDKLYPTIANWFNSPIINSKFGDYWQRLSDRVSINKKTGHLHIPMFTNTAFGQDSTLHCTGFYGGASLIVDSDEIDRAISLWVGDSSSGSLYTPIGFR